jgi:hypothetical protein
MGKMFFNIVATFAEVDLLLRMREPGRVWVPARSGAGVPPYR